MLLLIDRETAISQETTDAGGRGGDQSLDQATSDPTASDDSLGADKWAIGPAFGFVARAPGLLWGVFNQNLFSFAGDDDREDVDVSMLQPILNCSLPLGLKVAKLMRFGRQPLQFSASYEHNFADDYPAPAWTVSLVVKLLFPVGG